MQNFCTELKRLQNVLNQPHWNDNCTKKILPPYGRVVNSYTRHDELIVCTGSGSWQRAKSKTWFGNVPKLVLPLGQNPEKYCWPVSEKTVMIFGFGRLEQQSKIIELSRCLLQYRALWVLWVLPNYPITKVERQIDSMEVA